MKLTRPIALLLAGGLVAGCGDAPTTPSQRTSPLEAEAPGVLVGDQGDPADAAALAELPTRDEVDELLKTFDGKLTPDGAAALLTGDELPSAEALAQVLRAADLEALATAMTHAQADELLVPKELIPPTEQLLSKEEAAKTFVLASAAPPIEEYALLSDLPDTSTLLTKEQSAELFPAAVDLAVDYYTKAAAEQKLQSAEGPLSPALEAKVKDVVAATLASRPCPEGSLAAGDACVDRFEASVWSSPTCEGTQYGASEADDYPASFPDSGDFSGLPLYACSKPGVRPSAYLTWFQAQQACVASGKRLCTLAEWQTAAAGTPDDPATCHIDPFTGNPSKLDAASECASAWGVLDMVGNVAEWTGTLRVAGKKWVQESAYESTKVWPEGYGDGKDTTLGLNGFAAREADEGAYKSGMPAAVVRGGSFLDGSAAGVFNIDWTRAPTEATASIGFRCCQNR